MNRLGLFCFVAFTIFLSGCASQLPPVHFAEKASNPGLNLLSTVEVGQNLYERLGHVIHVAQLDGSTEVLDSDEYNYYWLLLGYVGAGIMFLTPDEVNIEELPELRDWPLSN